MRKMMKFFRKHRKAVSPVIAVMLLVAVAVAAVGAYFIWFRSFQTQTQKSVQETSAGALGSGLKVINLTDDGTKVLLTIKKHIVREMLLLDTSCISCILVRNWLMVIIAMLRCNGRQYAMLHREELQDRLTYTYIPTHLDRDNRYYKHFYNNWEQWWSSNSNVQHTQTHKLK